MRNGKHYLLTSGTTGYFPNLSEDAIADTWHDPYTVLGNPHPGDESNTSYHSQIPELIGKYGVIPPAQDEQRNTSIADYVWLPLRFDGENVIIDWLNEWRIEDYE